MTLKKGEDRVEMNAEMAIDKLKRLESLDLEVIEAEREYDRAKEAAKLAKDRLEVAQAAVFGELRSKPEPLPLFDRKANDAKDAPNDDWRMITVGEAGFSPKVRRKLKKAFANLGEVADHPGLAGIGGLTASDCEEISRVMDGHRSGEPAGGDATAKPNGHDDESWKAEPIETLLLPAKSVNEPLAAAGITTLGQLAAWTAPDARGWCKQLADIPGIGKGRAEKIEEASLRFFERRREAGAQPEATA